VETAIGITVSTGLSINKFLAKIAADPDKPRGFAVLGGQKGSTLSGAQTGELHLGRRSGDAGAVGGRWHHSYRRDLAATPEAELKRRYGAEGLRRHGWHVA
jgi:DNA polymerase IV